MGWKRYQTAEIERRAPGWQGTVWYPCTNSSLQISIFQIHQKSSTFHIFLNLTYPLRKTISFPKCPKLTQKFTPNRQTVVMAPGYGYKYRDLALLEM